MTLPQKDTPFSTKNVLVKLAVAFLVSFLVLAGITVINFQHATSRAHAGAVVWAAEYFAADLDGAAIWAHISPATYAWNGSSATAEIIALEGERTTGLTFKVTATTITVSNGSASAIITMATTVYGRSTFK